MFTTDSFNPPVPAGRGGKVIFAALAVAIGFVLYTLHQTRLEKSALYGTAGAPHWNFLIIVVDTLRYDVTSMAGKSNTPFMKMVADRAVSFSRAYSTYDSTPESHFSIFTGQRDGFGTLGDRPDASLAFQLRSHGYRTFGVSANGNVSQLTGNMVAGLTDYSCLYEEWQAMSAAQRQRHLPAIEARIAEYGARQDKWNQDQLYCNGGEVLTRFTRMLAAGGEPFFGFVNIMEAHDPYLPSRASLGEEPASARKVDPDLRYRTPRYPLANPEAVPDTALRASILQRLESAGGRAWGLSDDLLPEEIDTYKRRYEAGVRDADQVVKKVFAELERKQLLDRTWVLIVSDHGEMFGEGGFMTHSFANEGDYESSHHVPMIWATPSLLPRGVTVSDEVSLMDVAPTIYDLAGIDWAPLKQKAQGDFGRSLVSYLAGELAGPGRPPAVGADVPPTDRIRMRQEALERLRALGYIN